MSYSGPFVEVRSFPGAGGGKISRFRYRQKAPYENALPYSFSSEFRVPEANPYGFSDTSSLPGLTALSAPYAAPLSEAYARFKQSAYESVDLSVNIAERKQLVDSIAKRASQMLRFAKSLRAFRFREAARELGLRVISVKKTRTHVRMVLGKPFEVSNPWKKVESFEVKLKRNAKSFGNNYLEYHFGWEPLVKDIGNSVEILHSPVFPKLGKKCTGRATVRASDPTPPLIFSDFSIESGGSFTRTSVELSANVVIEDPNLFRLAQFGFVNPLTVAWEVTPFSFVLDWFVNVQQILAAYTDWVGMTLQNGYTTISCSYRSLTWYKGGAPDPQDYPRIARCIYGHKGFYVQRSLGISAPSLVLRPLKWPSVTRGLTAVSLLSQFLGK